MLRLVSRRVQNSQSSHLVRWLSQSSLLNKKGKKLNERIEFQATSGNGTTTTAFADMGLTEPSMRAIEEELGFTHATSVQDQTLPTFCDEASHLASFSFVGDKLLL